MNVSIIGSGYVGLCTGIGLAIKRNKVICVDIDKTKVENINNGIPPIYENGLEENLKKVLKRGAFSATTDISYAVNNSEITFIAVGTPSREDGSIDLNYVKTSSEQIGSVLKNKKTYHVVVMKSTVVPGTIEDIVIPALERSGKRCGKDFGVCMNPEFLREGFALEDFLNPDRIVIGEYDKKSGNVLEKLYKNFNTPIVRCNLKTAEMIKYASNAFLATKISFINEIGNLCKKLGIDAYDVAKAMGYDKRIAPYFLNAGVGFGGSCFPKDVSAIIAKANEMKVDAKILKSVMDVNKRQRLRIVKMLKEKLNINGKKIAILGLSFKAGTDDVRDSVAIDIIKELLRNGAIVHAYDPKAMGNMKKMIQKANYEKSVKDCLNNADACLILTDWDEFRLLTDKDFNKMKNKIIIEGRKTLDKNKVKGFEGVCW
jgi:UDPglucose 6-dehydrogenase